MVYCRDILNFTGKIAETTDGKWYYCTDGRPDFKFSGKSYKVVNGVVKQKKQ